MKWLLAIAAMTGPLVFSGEPEPRVIVTENSTAPLPSSMDALDDTRILKIGDRISLRIAQDKDKLYNLLVQADGTTNCPHLGPIKAAGRTMKKLAFAVKVELEKEYFMRATVFVSLSDLPVLPDVKYFSISRTVGRQEKYEIKNDEELTLAQAIMRAGGIAFRPPTQIKIIRKTPEGEKTIQIDWRPFFDAVMKNDNSKDIRIFDGDVIIFSDNHIKL